MTVKALLSKMADFGTSPRACIERPIGDGIGWIVTREDSIETVIREDGLLTVSSFVVTGQGYIKIYVKEAI